MLIHVAADNDVHPPRFGGAQRTFGLARGLARRHRVRLLGVVPNRSHGAREETVQGVELLRRKAWHTGIAWRLERAGLAPMFALNGAHARNAARYRAALGAHPDVLATDLNLCGMLSSGAASLRVYASQNVEYDRFVASAPRVAWRAAWASRLRRLEQDAVTRADLTVTCTDEDAARMLELYRLDPARVAVVPNGYDETELRPPSPSEREAARSALQLAPGEHAAVFVGADWGPNREALALLVDAVLPRLAGDGVTLLVAGSVARGLGARRERWLRVVGETPSLLPVLHAADSGLNPVRSGGGSNVKVPAYLAAGLAVVSTPFGLRGYAPLAPCCVVAPEDGLADALRAKPRGWSVRGESAPGALEAFAWGTLGERLGELYAERLGRLGATRGAA